MTDTGRALVVGVSGIAGNNVAKRLISDGWAVDGVSRSGAVPVQGVRPVVADLLDRAATATALADVDPTHVFFCTWQRRPTEAENIEVNTTMLRNLLDPLVAGGGLRHVALVTGLKHYLGPFESYGKAPADTPFHEEQQRLPAPNFYYEQEDVLFEAAARGGFTWSVHRPHTMIGWALGNLMNMGVTLAVYGALCRETGQPFVFPGSPQQYSGVTDITDARLLAEQLVWAAEAPEAADQAFNTVNGDVFRWRRMWEVVAGGLGVPVAEYPGHAQPLEKRFADAGPLWDGMVAKYGLRPNSLDHIASWWHTDGDLGREMETFADMTKSRRHGFSHVQDSRRSFLDLFDELRRERIIPPLD